MLDVAKELLCSHASGGHVNSSEVNTGSAMGVKHAVFHET